MASGDAQDATILNADNERLHQELARLSRKVASAEDRASDNAENGLVIRGK
jgi:hypothetical protein